MKPPPSPVVPASTSTANTSRPLRTATSAPVIAKTKMPTRSSVTSTTPGWPRVGSMDARVGGPGGWRCDPPGRYRPRRHRPRRLGAVPREPPRRNRMKEWATPMEQQDLTLVGLSEDKQRLVLVSDSGQEFTLAADARLRAALRGEHARLGQLEITMESSLRPRDIQARIRAGASPEDVAAAAQTTLDRVMGYAIPVLAERAHIADRAQRASVRRSGGEGPSRVLTDAVAERLSARNVDPDSVVWDAWRREDGRWTLVADYRSGESARHAEFVFDAPGRYVVAEDDEARWLVGEQTPSKGPQPRTSGHRRLSAVGSEDEVPLGEDAIGMVSAVDPHAPAQNLTATADWIATQASERAVPVELGSEADDADLETEDEPGTVEQDDETAPERQSDVDAELTRRTKKGRRASVPSWDEIMFGGGGKRD